MIQGLLIVFVVKVRFTQLRIGSYQDEKVFSMNIHEDFAYSELLNSYLDLPIKVLAHKHFVKLISFINYLQRKINQNDNLKYLLKSPQIL